MFRIIKILIVKLIKGGILIKFIKINLKLIFNEIDLLLKKFTNLFQLLIFINFTSAKFNKI